MIVKKYEGYIDDCMGSILLKYENVDIDLFDDLSVSYEEGENIFLCYILSENKDSNGEIKKIKGVINRIDYLENIEHVGVCECDKDLGDYLYEDEICSKCKTYVELESIFQIFKVDHKNIFSDFYKNNGKYLTLFINDRRIIIEDILKSI